VTGTDWHAMNAARVASHFRVDPSEGLSEPDAAQRLARSGPNQPTVSPERSALIQFLAQLTQPLVLVLIAASVVTAALGEWVDSSVIAGVVLVNAVVGFIQEGKAAAALAALARAMKTDATVLRERKRRGIDAVALTPGDIVVLAAGDKVPADVRLLSARELRTAEAALTGESTPVDKDTVALPADTVLADRRNMAYAGTLVVGGQAHGIVVATGDATETGRISRLIAHTPDLATPLTRKIGVFARHLLLAILMLAALTFAIGVLRGESAVDMFMAAVALAVGAIPEGLPAAMTITLAIGVSRMARRQAIIRKLPAVETLGSTTVICSDKTGTLTENAMTVREIWTGGDTFTVTGHGYAPAGGIEQANLPADITAALRETLLIGVLCNDARLIKEGQHWAVVGDPTEAALLVAARKGGLDDATLNSVFPRLDELPFDSSRQYMATLHEIEGTRVIYVKGAAERILPACSTMLDPFGRPIAFDSDIVGTASLRMANAGLRVLAVARSEIAPGQQLAPSRISSDLVFVGFTGMIDPPRPRAIAAVRTCHAAGIRVKMITGDHPHTALTIARQLGIAGAHTAPLTGKQLSALDDVALQQAASTTDVFARVEPEQKLRLVKALQANGEVVAMTGDGVNDAPALKQADIGIAMGLGGTEVAKEAAAMVLTDDNFATIEAAVAEGRGIYDNLIKFLVWTIPTNASEGLVILAAVFAGSTLPITPLQILWINMTTAVLLGTMLAFEPAEHDVMHRPPRRPGLAILDRVLVARILLVSLFLLAGTFGLFEFALGSGRTLAEARTIAANVFVLVEALYLFNCRSLTMPVWTIGVFSNSWAWVGFGSMLVLQVAFTYLPVANRLFQTAPIGMREWAWITVVAVACSCAVEVEKWLRRRHLSVTRTAG